MAVPGARADDNQLAHSVLACFHPTGEFTGYRTRGQWSGADRYGADNSKIYDIDFEGAWSRNEYTISVAVMVRTDNGKMQFRGEILSDTAVVPANENCRLKYWSNVGE